MRILVVTRSYPAADDLYQYPFVHRRVLAYREAGHEVAVFRPSGAVSPGQHLFDTVLCHSGDRQALDDLAGRFQPEVIAAHGFSESMAPFLAGQLGRLPVCAWLHGSEIPGFARQKAEALPVGEERHAALETVRRRTAFWRGLLHRMPERFRLVFVSRSALDLAREDLGDLLPPDSLAVIHNPIDTDLFAYRPRRVEDRLHILMLRPFDSRTYGNDLAVSAILHLRERDGFDRLRFTILGRGPMFDETVRPLRNLANVDLREGFLSQREIAEEHGRHGMFLVPTRLDTQGVSRDEAMSSGLVPVTNAVSAVPEFVDEGCAGLAAPDDAAGLADAIWTMVNDPQLYLARSNQAAARVRAQSGHRLIIPRELALLQDAAHG